MNIETVNELIQSLESAGELSIKESKYLELAKEFKQLAAENLQIKAMNDCLSEELRGYESDGAFEGPKMHLLWWQVETPATDAYLAGIKADGVEEFVSNTVHKIFDESDAVSALAYLSLANSHVKQLREVADK
ncbi:hypothetical protein G9400_06615 [Klebsiella michiganensis]|uniref:hypothetical protein n=1 Tax=Klebsiella grimontii TaxID=2058152 RepID=UPI0009B69C07|nr:hypothetical protein [Klebsiella grimontii]ARB25425.1 hypothetical protein AM394_11215 [Klebsiella oxytoca]NHE79817.1 hypothetical protein [Klebsiella michiganensis]MBZ7124430.1 hypothetical protein [Klebsiella grimontii]HDT6006957.1 hypothetical protein [Klebsiella michiganensis]HDX9077711.1 hypothetical protein [Klebsiella michiganensis]